jgi:D-methionine transport system permease protein
VRPIPFVIFLTAIQPLMLVAIGTTIGTNAVTFALSLAAAFAVSRIIEQNLLAVEPSVIVIVQTGQFVGNALARRALRR